MAGYEFEYLAQCLAYNWYSVNCTCLTPFFERGVTMPSMPGDNRDKGCSHSKESPSPFFQSSLSSRPLVDIDPGTMLGVGLRVTMEMTRKGGRDF